jgi:AraC-like DNA-binding protein
MLQSAKYSDIDAMQSACIAAGWSVVYRQIQAGPFSGTSNTAECGGITLLDESFNRRIEVAGRTPGGQLTVVLPDRASDIWVNGADSNDRVVQLFGPDTEMRAFNRTSARLVSMHVPVTLLPRAGICDSNESMFVELGTEARNNLLRSMHAAIYLPMTSMEKEDVAAALILQLEAIVEPSAVRRSDIRVQNCNERRIIGHATDYIDSNLNEAFSIGELSNFAATSMSKLERTFKHQLGLTPSQYIQARRLSAVNHRLRLASPTNAKISDIAMQFGFNHLGRFAGAYLKYFGESPIRTLRTTYSS